MARAEEAAEKRCSTKAATLIGEQRPSMWKCPVRSEARGIRRTKAKSCRKAGKNNKVKMPQGMKQDMHMPQVRLQNQSSNHHEEASLTWQTICKHWPGEANGWSAAMEREKLCRQRNHWHERAEPACVAKLRIDRWIHLWNVVVTRQCEAICPRLRLRRRSNSWGGGLRKMRSTERAYVHLRRLSFEPKVPTRCAFGTTLLRLRGWITYTQMGRSSPNGRQQNLSSHRVRGLSLWAWAAKGTGQKIWPLARMPWQGLRRDAESGCSGQSWRSRHCKVDESRTMGSTKRGRTNSTYLTWIKKEQDKA